MTHPLAKEPSFLELAIKRILPAYQQVAEEIRTLVIRGELRPGQYLPPEGELALLFGVGRSTIREALRLLASQGLVATMRGAKGGTFIVSPDRDSISRYLESSLGLLIGNQRPMVEDLLEARIALERPAARLAAVRRSKVQLDDIAATIPEGRVPSVPNEEMYQSEFHRAVLKASGNMILEVMARPVFDVLRVRLLRNLASPKFWERVVEEHRKIFDAITRGDEKGAEVAMYNHLVHLSSVYREIDSALHSDISHAADLASRQGSVEAQEKGEEDLVAR